MFCQNTWKRKRGKKNSCNVIISLIHFYCTFLYCNVLYITTCLAITKIRCETPTCCFCSSKIQKNIIFWNVDSSQLIVINFRTCTSVTVQKKPQFHREWWPSLTFDIWCRLSSSVKNRPVLPEWDSRHTIADVSSLLSFLPMCLEASGWVSGLSYIPSILGSVGPSRAFLWCPPELIWFWSQISWVVNTPSDL